MISFFSYHFSVTKFVVAHIYSIKGNSNKIHFSNLILLNLIKCVCLSVCTHVYKGCWNQARKLEFYTKAWFIPRWADSAPSQWGAPNTHIYIYIRWAIYGYRVRKLTYLFGGIVYSLVRQKKNRVRPQENTNK